MLRSLHIRNYVLIDSLDVDFPEGLVIITGQTGAGKSILLGALSLLMGAKADASVISEGADSCVVEAEFDVAGQTVRELTEQYDLDCSSDRLVIRRVVSASGRSRSFIGDEPVQVGVLAALSSHLIDIHSQHGSLLLTDRSFQLSLLDRYAGNIGLLAECRSAYASVSGLKRELSDVAARMEEISGKKDYDEARLSRLQAACLKEGEMDDLEAEQACLANAVRIKENLQEASSCLDSSELSGASLATSLKEAVKFLSRVAPLVPEAASLGERLESVRLEVEDVSSELEVVNDRIVDDPVRLQAVEDRMSLLYDLMKMHGVRTVAELIGVRDALASELYDSSSLAERKEELEKALAVAEASFVDVCRRIGESRSAAAEGFSAAIRDSVRGLDLENADFHAELSPCAPGPSGTESVTFKFSSTGRNLQDVAHCASGGEMSRIMLCLKAMMARFTDMPTLIFDEIDTGVSGSTADKMGSMICSMGADMQVFSITHLPQVAAKGNAHYLVSKTSDATGKTVSGIRRLDDDERVEEIARMLSGSVVTPEAVANARSLLSI